MKNFGWWILCVILFSALLRFVGGQTCGEIGTVDSGSFQAATGPGFYLNTQDAATCDGTINSLEYCYDRAEQTSGVQSYEFTAAVYRNTEGTYQPVSGRAFRVTRTPSNSNTGFGCGDPFVVDPPLEVRIGDMIGVCIYDPPDSQSRLQLDVVEQASTDDPFLMMTGTSGCGLTTVPTSVSSLTRIGGRVLHVWANIVPPVTNPPTSVTTMGTSQPTTTAPTTVPTTVGTSAVDTTGTDITIGTSTRGTTHSETTGMANSTIALPSQSTTTTIMDELSLPMATAAGLSVAVVLIVVVVGILTIAGITFIVFRQRKNNQEIPALYEQPVSMSLSKANSVGKGKNGDVYKLTEFPENEPYEMKDIHYYSEVEPGETKKDLSSEVCDSGIKKEGVVYDYPQPASMGMQNDKAFSSGVGTNEAYGAGIQKEVVYYYPQTPSREVHEATGKIETDFSSRVCTNKAYNAGIQKEDNVVHVYDFPQAASQRGQYDYPKAASQVEEQTGKTKSKLSSGLGTDGTGIQKVDDVVYNYPQPGLKRVQNDQEV